jgi:hypothetical protein
MEIYSILQLCFVKRIQDERIFFMDLLIEHHLGQFSPKNKIKPLLKEHYI